MRTTTRTVVLDVVVTDAAGNPVRNLTRDDFALREDGKPQSIDSFSAVSDGQATTDVAPHTILIIDELNTEFEDIAYARYSLTKLLKRENGQLDQPTELLALTNKGLVILTGYTRSTQTLQTALDRHKTGLPWRLHRGFYAAMERVNLSLTVLQDIAVANVGVPGRKNVVWISPGFPIMSALTPDPRAQQMLFDSIRRLSDQMLTARISVYSIDPRGVLGLGGQFSVAGGARGSAGAGISNDYAFGAYLNALSSANQASFGDIAVQTLAVQTGGRALFGRNDVDRELATTIAEGNTYYTISYAPTNKDFDGKFRKVAVTLSRPGFRVRTRDGYYALPEGAQPTQAVIGQELSGALTSPLPYRAVQIVTTYTTFSKSPDRVKITLIIPSTDLTWSPGADGKPACDVYMGVLGNPETEGIKHALAQEFQPPLGGGMTTPDPHRSVGFTFTAPVHYPIAHLRIVIRDMQSGRLGSVDITDIQQPSGPAAFTKLQKR